jgi:hypothetical protein
VGTKRFATLDHPRVTIIQQNRHLVSKPGSRGGPKVNSALVSKTAGVSDNILQGVIRTLLIVQGSRMDFFQKQTQIENT